MYLLFPILPSYFVGSIFLPVQIVSCRLSG
jgi:hypothetical protein